jgi:hypothetical protein
MAWLVLTDYPQALHIKAKATVLVTLQDTQAVSMPELMAFWPVRTC